MSSILDKYKKAVTEEREEHRPRVETLKGQPYKAYELSLIHI